MTNKKDLLIEVSRKLLEQLLICVGALLFFTFYFGITISNLGPAFTFGAFLLPVTLAMVNVYSFHIIPTYLFQQKHWWFLVYTIYTIIISIFLITLSAFSGYIFINSLETLDNEFMLSKNLYLIIIGVYIVVLLTTLFSAYRESYKIQLRNQELQYTLVNGELLLKKEELSYLKMQIHPHFLFNTLNTIYGSAIAKSDETPELILKLSKLLDYILYQTPKSLVPLQDEIDHLQDYLALEKLRHKSNFKITVSFPEQPSQLMIAPMLFLPLLENSFKHGKPQEKEALIELNIKTQDETVLFFLKNTFEETANMKSFTSSGIGLQNIKKRLQLLYPDAHIFHIQKLNGQFIIELQLNTVQIKPKVS
ncbi:sensor histidine kinase [Echinicola sp. 20G]|uniref:sensor histidine kinase n=1 Tax=Echinicola sp. 20G TaxID=2781961 RepID=UPI0019103C4F|nr:histidine kinase [Echinicola sp. 20G]